MMTVSRLGGCEKLKGDLLFEVECYPPDRRRRDLDNLLKCLQDSLVHAGAMEDDSQIKELCMKMNEPIEGGMVHVRLVELERNSSSTNAI